MAATSARLCFLVINVYILRVTECILACNNIGREENILPRIRELEPGTRFTPDLGQSGAYATLRGLDQESSGAERQGRRLCSAMPTGQGEAGCHLTRGY